MSLNPFNDNKAKISSDTNPLSEQGCSLFLSDKEYSCYQNETVLDALLRQQVDAPYACRQQSCQSCLMRSLDTVPPSESQENLKETLKAQNYFLACACVPTQNMEIALQETVTKEVCAQVIEIEKLNETVMAIFLEYEGILDYRAGQTIILMNEDKLGKNYHITSATSKKEDKQLEIHIPLVIGGYFSEWIHNKLKIDDTVYICGPTGHHFYLASNSQQPLLFIAEGTGLSPLVGIIEDALESEHNGDIYLFHGTKQADRLYLVGDFKELAEYCSNFYYYPCVSTKTEGYLEGRADKIALQTLPELNNYKVFICGQSYFVKNVQREAYLAGASTKEIYSIFLSN
ncbi:MAG: 2Fe-2S iron-sulfur cluster binding domain-containing protein [Methylococcaceae bacterium]|nr:2Fe-2S iron-sulfur cluster binding domain-containing protein [Methylococcaceae bacterium]